MAAKQPDPNNQAAIGDEEQRNKNAIQQTLDGYERAYKDGYKNALFQAIGLCGREKIILPEWAVTAFHRAIHKWYSFNAPSLDDAFEMPATKGLHINRLKKERRTMFGIHNDISLLQKTTPGLPIDENLFHEVGAKYGLGKTKTNDLYYICDEIMYGRTVAISVQEELDRLDSPSTSPTPEILARISDQYRLPVKRIKKYYKKYRDKN